MRPAPVVAKCTLCGKFYHTWRLTSDPGMCSVEIHLWIGRGIPRLTCLDCLWLLQRQEDAQD